VFLLFLLFIFKYISWFNINLSLRFICLDLSIFNLAILHYFFFIFVYLFFNLFFFWFSNNYIFESIKQLK